MLVNGELITEGRAMLNIEWDSENPARLKLDAEAGFYWHAKDVRAAAIALSVLAGALESVTP